MVLAKCNDTSKTSLTAFIENKTALEIVKVLNAIKINEEPITAYSNHLKCITQHNTALSGLVVKKQGYEADYSKCHALIEIILIEIFEWYGNEISINTIKSLAKTVYQNYYWLRLTELKLFAEKMKSASYGKQYGHLSPASIMEKLAEFSVESTELRVDITMLSHDKVTHHEKEDRKGQMTRDAISFHQAQMEHFKNNIEKQD